MAVMLVKRSQPKHGYSPDERVKENRTVPAHAEVLLAKWAA